MTGVDVGQAARCWIILRVKQRRVAIGRRRLTNKAVDPLDQIGRIVYDGRQRAERRFEACHHESSAHPFAGYVSDSDTEPGSGQLEKIVVIPAHLSRRSALPAIVETRHSGQPLWKQMLLHVASDLYLPIQSLALSHLSPDCGGQAGDLLGEGGLTGRFRLDTVESGGNRAFSELIRFDFVPCDQIGGETLLVAVVPQ